MMTYAPLSSYLAQFFSELDILKEKVVDKIQTHILCSITHFFSENRAVYEIMWKNMVQRDRPQMAVWRMRIACWVTKATDTYSEYVIQNDTTDAWTHNTTIYIYIYMTVTANNYMLRPLAGHHQVVHWMKRGLGTVQPPNPAFHSMYNLTMAC